MRHEVNADRSRLTITAQTRLSGSQEVGGFVEQVERYGAAHLPPDVRVHATGTVVLLDRSADALAWSQVTGDGQVMLILLALMSLLLRSLRLGLLSMVPNVVPIALLLGIMGWAGIDLNICTSTIASISIGIAVDDTIHYMLGFHAALRAGASREEAILSTLRGVGRPILIAAIALCAGFLIVCLSNFQPVRHFGLLCSVTMVIAVFTELFLLPALLVTLRVGQVAVQTPVPTGGGGDRLRRPRCLRGGDPLGQKSNDPDLAEEFIMSRSSLVLGLTLAVSLVSIASLVRRAGRRGRARAGQTRRRCGARRAVRVAHEADHAGRPGARVHAERQDARQRHRRALPRGDRTVQPQGHALPVLRPQRAARRSVHVRAVHEAHRPPVGEDPARAVPRLDLLSSNDIVEPPIDDYTYAFVGDGDGRAAQLPAGGERAEERRSARPTARASSPSTRSTSSSCARSSTTTTASS